MELSLVNPQSFNEMEVESEEYESAWVSDFESESIHLVPPFGDMKQRSEGNFVHLQGSQRTSLSEKSTTAIR